MWQGENGLRLDAQFSIEKMVHYLRHISSKNKKKPLILFFGREKFCDNSKYLFLDCQNNANYEAIWCSTHETLVERLQAHGLPAFNLTTDIVKSVALLLSASVAIYCANPHEALETELFLAAISGAKQVQLWHGVGTKKLDLALLDKLPLMSLPQVQNLRWAASVDTVVSPSARYDSLWHESFGALELIRAGLPRNEVLMRPATAFEQIDSVPAADIETHDGMRILWAPTFSQSVDGPAWRRKDLAEAILRGAEGRNPRLYIRPHPYDHARFVSAGLLPPDCTTLLSSQDDIYPVLRHFDFLITDRSSLLSDFLLLDRPILLLDDQNKPEPESDIVYEGPLPGIVADYADAEAAVKSSLDSDLHREARAANFAAIFETNPLTACGDIRRVIERFIEQSQQVRPVLL